MVFTIIVVAAFKSPTALTNAYGWVHRFCLPFHMAKSSWLYQICRVHGHVHHHNTHCIPIQIRQTLAGHIGDRLFYRIWLLRRYDYL